MSTTEAPAPRAIVLGIAPGLPRRVIDEAVSFAHDLGSELVCAFVDETRIPIGITGPDGTPASAPVSPEGACTAAELDTAVGEELTATIASTASSAGVDISYRTLAGDPAVALARLAAELDARAIVIGTRQPGIRAAIRLLVAGRVSSRLAQRQQVPVIVVPVHEREVL